ncbi:hypothetical protein AVEN_110893-1 [Araneus ventricosus]|uniref:Uncharacterized protein n=1 Tax=Araneus ventricosus TaxID=182803 RepID=A0A4Y2X2S4_ARAVE|nr:hypothetical protein AVEN_110893-1 [Araneus ventricosus]
MVQSLDNCFYAPLKGLYSSETEKWLVQNPGKAITLYKVSGIFQKLYSATAMLQLAEKASRVAVTLVKAPFDEDCAVAVAPEENEVSPSASWIYVSIQSLCHFLDMNNEELKGKENLKNLRS